MAARSRCSWLWPNIGVRLGAENFGTKLGVLPRLPCWSGLLHNLGVAFFRSGVETSARWRSDFLLPRRSGRLRTWLWERARSVLSEYSAHAGHGVCAVRSCAKTEALGRWWVRGRALVRWWKGVRGGAAVSCCRVDPDRFGHGCGNGHGMLRPDFPRTQVTDFVRCAVAQKRSQSDTMTARPRTS